jgi:hypothetical protein
MEQTATPYRPGHGGYVSEFEQFMADYAQAHPRTHEEQLQGWYLLWDRPVDFDALARARADAVPVKSYQYE